VEDLEDAGWTTSKTGEECVKRARERQQWRELVWSSSMSPTISNKIGLQKKKKLIFIDQNFSA